MFVSSAHDLHSTISDSWWVADTIAICGLQGWPIPPSPRACSTPRRCEEMLHCHRLSLCVFTAFHCVCFTAFSLCVFTAFPCVCSPPFPCVCVHRFLLRVFTAFSLCVKHGRFKTDALACGAAADVPAAGDRGGRPAHQVAGLRKTTRNLLSELRDCCPCHRVYHCRLTVYALRVVSSSSLSGRPVSSPPAAAVSRTTSPRSLHSVATPPPPAALAGPSCWHSSGSSPPGSTWRPRPTSGSPALTPASTSPATPAPSSRTAMGRE